MGLLQCNAKITGTDSTTTQCCRDLGNILLAHKGLWETLTLLLFRSAQADKVHVNDPNYDLD